MTDYQAMARQAATQAGIDPGIFVAQIQRESGFNPRASSPAGAQGIAQFMPGTAAGMGVNPWDPTSALQGAANLDAQNLKKYHGDYGKMLAAYNAGGGSVDFAVAHYQGSWLKNLPSETQQYVATILGSGSAPAANNGTTTSATPAASGGILGQLKTWGEYSAIFVMALLLIIVGFLLIAGKQTVQAGKGVAKVVLP